jgi:hypothetical protein
MFFKGAEIDQEKDVRVEESMGRSPWKSPSTLSPNSKDTVCVMFLSREF